MQLAYWMTHLYAKLTSANHVHASSTIRIGVTDHIWGGDLYETQFSYSKKFDNQKLILIIILVISSKL